MVAGVGEVGSSGVFDASVKNDALTVVRKGDSLTFTFVSKDRSEKGFYEAIAAEYHTTPEAVKWACTSPNSENKKRAVGRAQGVDEWRQDGEVRRESARTAYSRGGSGWQTPAGADGCKASDRGGSKGREAA